MRSRGVPLCAAEKKLFPMINAGVLRECHLGAKLWDNYRTGEKSEAHSLCECSSRENN